MALINGKTASEAPGVYDDTLPGHRDPSANPDMKILSHIPPSPPPTLPLILPSGSPPPSVLPSDDDESDKNGDEIGQEDKESSESSGSELITPPTSEINNSVQVVTKGSSQVDSYPIPPIPQTSVPLIPPRRTKSTGILNYPSEYTRSRSCSLPSGDPEAVSAERHLHSASCSSSSLNVKFAPLPQLAPRKRKSNTPLGVAARGQLMRRRRQLMNGGEYGSHQVQGQPNMYGDVVEPSEDEAAARARARARGSGGYGVDEDGEEMEDPFVALGKMFKGAWKRMRGGSRNGKEKECPGNGEAANGDAVDIEKGGLSIPEEVETPAAETTTDTTPNTATDTSPDHEQNDTEGKPVASGENISPKQDEKASSMKPSQTGSIRRK
ncbi:hypothetical protein V5O48_006762 [Marasmius crinis-equi]|uniref:Uncharacterized protein n=1 Tax=Marasmius crinis-equi TaxID=585013 RepID=A0ABR3FIK1_9AGAR